MLEHYMAKSDITWITTPSVLEEENPARGEQRKTPFLAPNLSPYTVAITQQPGATIRVSRDTLLRESILLESNNRKRLRQ
jgi:hypothetical protein